MTTTVGGSVQDWTQADGSPGGLLRQCLRAATAAPSIHNTQPWLFDAHGGTVDVFLDERRRLTVLDPDGREMHLSVGAALLNLRVAIIARGRVPRVRLLPDPDRPHLAASVTLGRSLPPSPLARAMAHAIGRRRTNRRPFAPTPIPRPTLAAVTTAARAEGADLILPDHLSSYDILRLVRTANKAQESDAGYLAELAAWTTPIPGHTDGVPREAYGPRPDPARVPLRDFGLVHARQRRGARFEANPTIAVLYSGGDRPIDWLRAGLALQRVLLTATVHGLATTLLTQPMEIPALRAEFRAAQEPRFAQAVLRLGYAYPSPPTPRRPLGNVFLPRA